MDAPYAVQLTVPAQADSARLARLVAAALAADAGWTIDDTEDLRIAVSELMALLVEGEEDTVGQVELSYERTSDSVQISGRRANLNASGAAVAEIDGVEPDDLALEILRVVVDEHHFTQDPSGRQFHLVKRARNHT